jgi:hypothetical protein
MAGLSIWRWAGVIKLGVADQLIATGSGTPEGALAADPGSFYMPNDGSNPYVKTTGTGNTGWIQIVGGVFPQTKANVSHKWLNSYDAATGLFTQTQPAYSDLTGTPTLPANTPAVTHQFITAYDSSTGVFAQAQPTVADVTGAASPQGVNAITYGVTGNGHFRYDAVSRFFTLTQVAVSGGNATYTGTITGGGSNAFVGYVFTITGFTNSGNNVQITVTASTATTLVCVASTQVNETHAGNAGANTIDCPTGNFTVDATVGQLVFATDLSTAGFTKISQTIVPQGTITAVVSATRIVVSRATSVAGGQTCLVWGDDQSTALTNAWTATQNCKSGMLMLPAINPQGTGPAVILVQSAQLNSNATSPGTGGNRSGLGAYGGGINATYIVPTPSFDFTSTLSNVCFLNVSDGAYFHDFSIWGAGVSNPSSGLNSKIIAQITASNNAKIHDVAIMAWGQNVTNGIGIGLKVLGGEIMLERIDLDMAGGVGCQCSNGGNLGGVFFSQCTFWDNGYINLYVAGNASNPVWTINCNFGNAGQAVSVNGSGIWHDFGSVIGLPTTGGFSNAVLLGFTTTVAGTTSGGTGTVFLNGTQVDCPLSGGGHVLYLDNVNCSATLVGCFLKDESTQTCVTNNGVLVNGGGNSFSSAGTLYGGTGTVAGSLSFAAATGGLTNTGVVATYKNIATVSNGIPSEIATVDLTAQSAAIAATTLYAVPAAGVGMYRIAWVAKVTTAATSSSTLGGTNGFQITYTDSTDSVVVTTAASVVSTLNTTQAVISGEIIVFAKASTNIQYSIGYTSSGATAMVYNLHVKCEAL